MFRSAISARLASFTVLALFSGSCAAAGAEIDAQGLLTYAQAHVFKLQVTDADSRNTIGSCVLLKVEPAADGVPPRATFVTAYHVVHRARSLTVRRHDGLKVNDNQQPIECFPARTRELAFFRVTLAEAARGDVALLNLANPLEQLLNLPPPSAGPVAKPQGMAFGYSREAAIPLDYSHVEFLNVVSALSLNLVRVVEPLAGEPSPNDMTLMLLTNQPTQAGMSGGLVIDSERRFGGLIYGRDTDRYNLAIPSAIVEKSWAAAQAKSWLELSHTPFDAPIAIDCPGGLRIDRLDWGAMDGLTLLFGNDPASAISQFQEITVSPPQMGANAPPLEIVINREATLPSGEHKLQLSLDGNMLNLRDHTITVPIELKKVDGESLLIVVKESGRANDFELGRLLAPSTVDITFKQAGVPFRQIIRSLPTIVHRYPLFISVRNALEPPSPLPANARLAIRLDYLERRLNEAPLTIGLEHGPDAQGSVFRGDLVFDQRDAWRLGRISPQRLGFTVRAQAKIQEARFQAFGLAFVRDSTAEPIILGPQGTVQFPSTMDEFFVSGRATGTGGNQGQSALRVEFGNGFALDAGGILRHLLTAHLNSRLLKPDEPHPIGLPHIEQVLRDIGLSAPEGWMLQPRQCRLVNEGGYIWLIGTVRMDHADAPPQPVAPAEPVELATDWFIPPHGQSVLQIDAHKVAGAVLAKFPLAQLNPWIAEVLAPENVDSMSVGLNEAEAGASLAPLDRPIEPLKDNGRSLAARLQQSFVHSIDQGTVHMHAIAPVELAVKAIARATNLPPLQLRVGGKSQLHIRATSQPPDVMVHLENGPCEFKSLQPIPIGGGATVSGAVITFQKFTVAGKLNNNIVAAALTASFSFGQIKANAATISSVKGTATVQLDTANEILAKGILRLAEGSVTYKGHNIKLVPADLKFSINKQNGFVVDPASWNEFLQRQLLGS